MKNFTKLSRDNRKLYTVVKMHVINSPSVNKSSATLGCISNLINYLQVLNINSIGKLWWIFAESLEQSWKCWFKLWKFGKRDDRLRFWRVLTARIEWKWNEFLSIVSALIKRTWWQHMSFVLELSLQADEKMFIPNEIFFGCAQI